MAVILNIVFTDKLTFKSESSDVDVCIHKPLMMAFTRIQYTYSMETFPPSKEVN